MDHYLEKRVEWIKRSLNNRADLIIEGLKENPYFLINSSPIEYPLVSLDTWYNALNESQQDEWDDIYHSYLYSSNWEFTPHSADEFTQLVVGYLMNKDNYFLIPFCACCDSRHHGECISH